jgi:glutaredoxin 3
MANIDIYTKATCPFCIRAKALLNSKGVTFNELPIDGDAAKREEMIQRSGRTTVPQIFIDAQHIGGCDDLYALDSRGGLDPLCANFALIPIGQAYLRTTRKGFTMSEQNSTEMTFQIQRIYTKDISLKRRCAASFPERLAAGS